LESDEGRQLWLSRGRVGVGGVVASWSVLERRDPFTRRLIMAGVYSDACFKLLICP